MRIVIGIWRVLRDSYQFRPTFSRTTSEMSYRSISALSYAQIDYPYKQRRTDMSRSNHAV